MRCYLLLLAVLVFQSVLCTTAVQATTATVVRPEVVVEEMYAFPHEGTANKLSSAYTYPEVRHIDAYLRFEVRGFVGERKLTAFVTMSSQGKVLAKKKEKMKLEAGRYEVTLPEMLDLRKVFGEHRVKLYVELALPDAPDVKQEYFFLVKGRELPRVEVLDFWMQPARYNERTYLEPGNAVECRILFRLEKSGEAPLTVRVVGVMDEERDLVIDPGDDRQEYDTCWDEKPGPRRDGDYILTFEAYLPRFFYEYSDVRHPFVIYVAFLAEDEIVKMVGLRETLNDYYPGLHRDAEEEALRLIHIQRAQRWWIRPASGIDKDRPRGWFGEL
ncbi:hypothetical protein J7J84_02100 [bacterium]|nr:hypothetical protein [bacterium]